MNQSLIPQEVVSECRKKLILMREELLNRMRNSKLEVTVADKMSGDEIDQTVAQQTENNFALAQGRLRQQLLEVEYALARIQKGIFGICEETNEPIEISRLLTLPYTRLSLEGAELRESLSRRFARS